MKGIKIFRNRKAVSPLIATVLLIAFAVALGAVVMNWGRSYIETTADFAREKSDTEIRCSMDINLDLIKIRGVDQICYNNDTEEPTLNFTIENGGTLTIAGVRIQVFGETGIVSRDINLSIGTAQVLRMAINYSDEGNGSIQQVRFIPQIKVDNNRVLCAQNDLIIEEVGLC